MNGKPLLILTLLFSFLLVGISRAGVSGSTFKVYIENTGSLGFQNTPDHNVTLTVSSGTLNSSESVLSIGYTEGVFIFNSSQNLVLTLAFSNETLDVSTKVDSASWIPRRNGDQLSVIANQNVGVKWRIVFFSPFDYAMPGIGLGGIILLCFSAFYAARQLRNFQDEDSIMGLGWGLLGILIGIGLIIVWLWP